MRFVPVRWALAAAVVLGLLPPLLVGGHVPVWAQTAGLQVDGEVTYRLEPGDATVQVTAELTLTNTMPSRTRGAFVETPYFPSFAIPAVGPVAGASARSSSGRDLPVTVRSEDDVLHAVDVDLIPNLVYGSPQTITVTFELPGQPSRSGEITTLGLELPGRKLTVVESTGGYHLGYAGVYIADLNLIEVGDELDRQVMLHELSHLWLNANLFAERWIFEGLAEEVSNRAAEELGESRTAPDPIDPDDPDLAYARSGGSIERTQISDRRYFYDLLDLVGGSERAHDLFAQHVLNEQQIARLDQRDIALEALHALEETAGGWTGPLAVRQEISRWRFETAHRLIDRASEMTARVDGLADAMAEVDIDPHGPIRDVHETADDLDDLDLRVERFEQVGRDLLAVHQRRGDAGPLQRVGLIGTGDTLAAAHDRYRNGQPDRAAELVARASHTTDRATQRGAALLIAVTLLGVAATAHLRSRRG